MAIKENQNRDLSATGTHVGSESIPQTVQYEDQSNAPNYWDNVGQSSYPNISGLQQPAPMPLNKTNLTENLISSSKLGVSPTEEEFVEIGHQDKQAHLRQIQSVPGRYLPPEMLQELFFDCI